MLIDLLKGRFPIGLNENIGNAAELVRVIALLVGFVVFFELFFGGSDFSLVGGRFKNDLLGGDDLLFGIIEGADGFHFRGNTSANNLGEVLGGEKIADVVVEATGATKGAGLVLDEVRVGFLIVVAFGVGKENVFDEAFDFVVAGSDSVFKSGLLSVQAICDEFVGRTAGLKKLRHLGDN